ncbi:MAG: hypothetical protein ICV77_08480 [Cyanobacteria bacterium Co-bin8]|nr:hypothetical protein [Cyanobacteria bacterium Co-bin8]MBD0335231.1 hypothetical protein [Cyanobacteria bacterium Co-bin13]
MSQLYYLLRSRLDGSYLAAKPRQANPDPDKPPPAGFLLVFSADYDALSYLNTHAPDLASKFSVETVASSQLEPVLSRWGFQGVGMVSEPMQPQVEFFKRSAPGF